MPSTFYEHITALCRPPRIRQSHLLAIELKRAVERFDDRRVTVPVTITIGERVYEGEARLLYTAKAGKKIW